MRTLTALATALVTALGLAPAPAAAQSSDWGSSGNSSSSSPSGPAQPAQPYNPAPAITPGLTVQQMGDVVGRGISDAMKVLSADLGIMVALSSIVGVFAIIFGDSFRGAKFGEGEWVSPVGATAHLDENGRIEIDEPLGGATRAEQLIAYEHDNGTTLIPSDAIDIDGTLYLQGMWNEPFGTLTRLSIYASEDNGNTWDQVDWERPSFMGGHGQIISWEKDEDGFVYIVSARFGRTDDVYLSRVLAEDIGDFEGWEHFDPATGEWYAEWNDAIGPVLSTRVRAGEMSLRKIDGYWVLSMFNEQTAAIEVRVASEITADWDAITPASVVIAGDGGWGASQGPDNFTQLYGGYIVPGTHLDNLGVVVSQWNTQTNSVYRSTQFQVRGLDEFFGLR